MVYFKSIKKSLHYIIHHEKQFPWSKVIEIILSTKNVRRKGDKLEIETSKYYILCKLEIETSKYYILCKLENKVLLVINAKWKK